MPLLVLLALLVAGPAAAQCCGDCNGDGQVDISELIRAVNSALGADCSPADSCPYTFDTLSLTNRCEFRGPFNATCGDPTQVIIAGDSAHGVIAAVLDTQPAVGFIATRTGPTTADLIGWSVAPFTDSTPTSGTLTLADGRATLIIAPDSPPFTISGCAFYHYRGAFERTIPASAAVSVLLEQARQNFDRTRQNFTRDR